MMDDQPSDSSSSPLISIGLSIFVVLLVPVALYSIGPEGPLKVGDVVFATDRHRVKFVNPTLSKIQGHPDYCILESRVQLVVEEIGTVPASLVVAQPIGGKKNDAPYCPPQISVQLHPNQITLKVDLWGGLRDSFSNMVSGQ